MTKGNKKLNKNSGDLLIKIPTIRFSPPPKKSRAAPVRVPPAGGSAVPNERNSAALDDQIVKIKLDFSFAKFKYLLLFLAVVTGIMGAAFGLYAYKKFVPENQPFASVANIKDNPSAAEIKNLVAKVAQIAILPNDELPEVIVIGDLTQTHANPFFKDASLKDYILIYKKAAKVILYNPTSNRIVNIGPYVVPSESSPSAKLQPVLEASDTAKTNNSPNVQVDQLPATSDQ